MNKLAPFTLSRQTLYSVGALSFNLTERMILLYLPIFYLPSKELGVHHLFPGGTFGGFLTIMGLIMVVGRVLTPCRSCCRLAKRSGRSPIGRRKLFKLISALPMALFAVLIFSRLSPYGKHH